MKGAIMKSANNRPAEIPEIVINDPYEYVTSNTIIVKLVIRGPHGERRMPFIKTKRNGYMVT
jgi:hypothetical protein